MRERERCDMSGRRRVHVYEDAANYKDYQQAMNRRAAAEQDEETERINDRRSRRKTRREFFGLLFGDVEADVFRKILLGVVIFVAVAAICGFAWIYAISPVLRNAHTQSTIDVESQLQKAVKIDELSTAEFHYGGIAVKKDDSGKEKWHVSYEATVTAGVTMGDIKFDVDDKAKTVTPVLPKVKILDAVIDSGSLDFFENNPPAEIDEVISLCRQDALRESRANTDISDIATDNLAQTVRGLTEDLVKAKDYTLKDARTAESTRKAQTNKSSKVTEEVENADK